MNTTMLRASLCSIVLGIAAMGCTSEIIPLDDEEAIASAAQEINTNKIIVYEGGKPVAQNQLSPLNPADFNIQPLQGNVDYKGQIDVLEGDLIGGVFQATQGEYRQVFPGVFHATVIVGSLRAKTGGKTYHLKRGDSFLVTKGTEVDFKTDGARHQASFLGNFGSPDMPGTFKVYKQGSTVPESELITLGTPADFNMTVLEGDPVFEARIDYAQGFESAGHFRLERSTLFVNGTTVTEHGSVTKYGMTMTRPDGTAYTLHAGDSYIVRAGSTQTWEVNGPMIYQAFFGVFVP